MDRAIFIDTNVYKMISKNQELSVKKFEHNLGHAAVIVEAEDPTNSIYLATTHFGFCEYLGLKLPKRGPSPNIWSDLNPPHQPGDATQDLINEYFSRFRQDLRQSLTPEVTSVLLENYIDEERKHQSEEFTQSRLYALFAHHADRPSQEFADELLDLTIVDSLHQSAHYPPSIAPLVEAQFRWAAYIELFHEYRNFAHLRSAKSAWINRVVTAREKNLPQNIVKDLDTAMKSIKTGGDRFDLELVTMFLFGHARGGEKKRNPAMIYTKDRKEQFMARAVVIYSILAETA